MATQTFIAPQSCDVDCYAIAGVVLNLYAGGLSQVHYREDDRRKTNNLIGAAAMIETYAG